MDNITDLEITVNGNSRTELSAVDLRDISDIYNFDTALSTTPNNDNTINVSFNKLVDLNTLLVNDQNLPDEITIVVRGTDENGETYTKVVNLTGNEFVLENIPPVQHVAITFVYSSNSDFSLTTEFLGCVHPGIVSIKLRTVKRNECILT